MPMKDEERKSIHYCIAHAAALVDEALDMMGRLNKPSPVQRKWATRALKLLERLASKISARPGRPRGRSQDVVKKAKRSAIWAVQLRQHEYREREETEHVPGAIT